MAVLSAVLGFGEPKNIRELLSLEQGISIKEQGCDST
jgi:hypothetical protein